MKTFTTTFLALALSLNVWAQQQDTMFIHMGQTILEIPTKDVDSIIFYRTQSTTPIVDGELSDAALTALNCATTVNSGTFGTVTWGGNANIETQVWNISGNGITQVWSDAVRVSNCDQTNYNGGSSPNFNTDCRNNPGHGGELFSWCFVKRYEALLCPAPWRVPTREDFRDLDIAMGGNGQLRPIWEDNIIENMYLNPSVWGGVGGGIYHNHDYGSPSIVFFYWSQTEANANRGFALSCITGSIHPQSDENKDNGYKLRCVQ